MAIAQRWHIGHRALSLAGWRLILGSASGGAILTGVGNGGSDLFVGRRRELEDLEAGLAAARTGHGSCLLLAGAAGIGKSRLAHEFVLRARAQPGSAILRGRCFDLVSTELPYEPFLDALRGVRAPDELPGRTARTQLQVFEDILTVLRDHAAASPVVLLLEDLHWADASTLDLIVFLAHHLADLRLLLIATLRPDEPASAERMQRFADGVRRSDSARVLELGPLGPDELDALLAARAGGPLPRSLTDAIVARSEGNPLFAEELLATADDAGAELPRRVRDLLLRRVARLDAPTQELLRVAAAAGRDVEYPLLNAVVAQPERQTRESLRQAVEHGVLVANQASGTFRFRHALLAEAVYATILPGEREEVHGRLAEALTKFHIGRPAELATHWMVAGRAAESLAASIQAAHEAEAQFGLAEAVGHLRRALQLWPSVPDAARLAQLDLAELHSWAAELASHVGDASSAVDLGQRAIDLAGTADPLRAALLYERLARYLHASGRADATLAVLERAVELVPSEPPTPQRAQLLAALAYGLMLAWRNGDALVVAEEAVSLARATDSSAAEQRALTAAGTALAYLGRADEGLSRLWRALHLAEDRADPVALQRAYIMLTDVLTMLGRPRESAELAAAGMEAMRAYGADTTVLVANHVEALIAIGEWDAADAASAAAVRAITASYPHMPVTIRAALETGRGHFDEARAHLAAAKATLRLDRDVATHHAYVADLALSEHRWTDAAETVAKALALARFDGSAPLRMWLCAQGLRAYADLVALARARRDGDAAAAWMHCAQDLLATARSSAADAAKVTADGDAWLAVAEAEYARAEGTAGPQAWARAVAAWERLQRPPLAAYGRWRQAEALVAAGAPRTEAAPVLAAAYAVATRVGAAPLAADIERLAQRARLDLTPPPVPAGGDQSLGQILGLTQREAEVLALVARGYTNREIAATLVISVKTASVHVSHILRKLDVPTRLAAAAVAHRLTREPSAP